MKERPILFSGEMVRAILEGRKSQTRRVVARPRRKDGCKLLPELLAQIGVGAACPYGKVGDRLWVKETFVITGYTVTSHGLARVSGYYCAGLDKFDVVLNAHESRKFAAWRKKTGAKPSIFMFNSLCRITLGIVSVRVERLQEISINDIVAEGVYAKGAYTADFGTDHLTPAYMELWESINGAGSWAKNPWVWVIEFKRITEAGK